MTAAVTVAVDCIDQTGQSFGFDYVGVIWGRDLRWDHAINDWMGDPNHSHDAIAKRSGFTDLVKRTYCVLLTRGLKGCYLYFEDVPTAAFLAAQTGRAVGLNQWRGGTGG